MTENRIIVQRRR